MKSEVSCVWVCVCVFFFCLSTAPTKILAPPHFLTEILVVLSMSMRSQELAEFDFVTVCLSTLKINENAELCIFKANITNVGFLIVIAGSRPQGP